MDITPEDIIEYNRRAILDDSAMFRGSGVYDLKRLKGNPFVVIYWYFKTLYNDIQTQRYFNNITTDPERWIIFEDDPFFNNNKQEEYIDWLKENEIGYDILWFKYHTQYGFAFENKEDAVGFKLRWL